MTTAVLTASVEKPTAIETCSCKFTNHEEERQARKKFLIDYGDDLPEDIITDMVSDKIWEGWAVKCNCANPKEIVAAGHYKPTDVWYLCTLQGFAVKKEWRGKGLGRETTLEVTNNALENPDCLVLAADIAFDNIPSLKTLRRAGFDTAGEFCWGKGKKPANILHLVKVKPTKDKTCLGP